MPTYLLMPMLLTFSHSALLRQLSMSFRLIFCEHWGHLIGNRVTSFRTVRK